LDRLRNIGLGRVRLAFLNEGARHVEPAIGIGGFRFGHFLEGVLGALEVALQQKADAPIVPALAIPQLRDRGPTGFAQRHAGVRLGERDDRQIGDAPADLAGNIAGNGGGVEGVIQAVAVGCEKG
jgi:hypothetical protein